jgi:hypothetical protein
VRAKDRYAALNLLLLSTVAKYTVVYEVYKSSNRTPRLQEIAAAAGSAASIFPLPVGDTKGGDRHRLGCS